MVPIVFANSLNRDGKAGTENRRGKWSDGTVPASHRTKLPTMHGSKRESCSQGAEPASLSQTKGQVAVLPRFHSARGPLSLAVAPRYAES